MTRSPPTPPIVAVTRCPRYELDEVRRAVTEILNPLGGMGAFVSRGDKVLVKPNFLVPSKAEKAVTTHPMVIQAVVEAALDAGAAQVIVGDSPAFGSGRLAARRLGLVEPLEAMGVVVRDLDDSVAVDNPGGQVFKRLELSRAVLEADRILNIAKLKTHGQMSMTLAVKNMFGSIVGTRKAAWHMEAGRDTTLFARMLVDVFERVAPALSLVDAVVGMEGNGPNAGTPREVGVLAASPSAAAVDQLMCEIVGFPPADLPTLQVMWERGGGPADLTPPRLHGPPLDELRVADYKMARPQVVTGIQGPLQRVARRLLEVRPRVKKKACTACERCLRHCPADAIVMVGKGPHARIDRKGCIHCFVCQEICPEGAIEVGRGLVRHLLPSKDA
jgi:uncharacterized protein (DUF362 family)/NAD-dependent dihydropyrimidine dehydrogenase PreA subunit